MKPSYSPPRSNSVLYLVLISWDRDDLFQDGCGPAWYSLIPDWPHRFPPHIKAFLSAVVSRNSPDLRNSFSSSFRKGGISFWFGCFPWVLLRVMRPRTTKQDMQICANSERSLWITMRTVLKVSNVGFALTTVCNEQCVWHRFCSAYSGSRNIELRLIPGSVRKIFFFFAMRQVTEIFTSANDKCEVTTNEMRRFGYEPAQMIRRSHFE